MALAYRPPGVTVAETVTPQVSPLLALPALICLVGETQGYQVRTDQFILSGTDPVALPGLTSGSTLSTVLSVKDSLNPSQGASDGSGYLLTTDYTVPAARAEIQTGTITGTPTGGTFTLTFNGASTAPIAYNATGATVQTGLQGLVTIGSGNVTVSGAAGGPYVITFAGALANQDLPLITTAHALTGGTTPNIAVVQTQAGVGESGAVARVGAGGIADGTLVNVTYTYVPERYYEPIRLFDLGSVESRFGSGLNGAGTAINSPVSYAASIAFENGAGSVVIQPLFARDTPGDTSSERLQPDATDVSSPTTWEDTLYALRDIEDVNVIVPIVGQSTAGVGDSGLLAIFQKVQDHCRFMATENQYIISLFGEDSSASSTVATQATLQSHANTLRQRYGGELAEQTVLVSPSKFSRALPGYGQALSLGGQYVAAAISGMLSSRSVSSSLTRKNVSGIVSVDDYRSLNEKNLDAQAGLFVVEQKQGDILVRHAITLDQTSAARRELSVVRAKHRMIESVKSTIDRNVIGQIIADGNAADTVASTIIAVLEQLRINRDLVDYSAVDARLLSLDPTTIQVRFSYRPSFPLNYVDIVFSLDLTSGTITTTGV